MNKQVCFQTQSGSIYEIDWTLSSLRRLSGTGEPTKRVGSDQKWKKFHSCSPPAVGMPVAVDWSGHEDPVLPGATPMTLTSPVVSILWETP